MSGLWLMFNVLDLVTLYTLEILKAKPEDERNVAITLMVLCIQYNV